MLKLVHKFFLNCILYRWSKQFINQEALTDKSMMRINVKKKRVALTYKTEDTLADSHTHNTYTGIIKELMASKPTKSL